MLNIEIFGFPPKQVEKIEETIKEALRGIVNEDDVIFTEHFRFAVEVREWNGNETSYVRLTGTKSEMIKAQTSIEDALPETDIETVILYSFRSGKK